MKTGGGLRRTWWAVCGRYHNFPACEAASEARGPQSLAVHRVTVSGAYALSRAGHLP